MLRIGTGGVPLTSKDRSTESGIKKIAELGLNHMELEFVQGVRMGEEKAALVRSVAENADVTLTVHGPYYVNLATAEEPKLNSSINYITESLRIGSIAGAKSVTFHPAFYQKLSKEDAYKVVKRAFDKLFKVMGEDKYKDVSLHKIQMSPELTGKPSQFGDIDELTSLAAENVKYNQRLCIDFAHKFARSNGQYNSEGEFRELLDTVKNKCGEEYLQELHMHVSGIMHSEKGEKHHVTFFESLNEYHDMGIKVDGIEKHYKELVAKKKNGGSAFNWKGLLKVLKEYKVGGYLVCESPILELDALVLQKVYQSL